MFCGSKGFFVASYLLLFVVLVFGKEPSFGPPFPCAWILWIGCLSVCALLIFCVSPSLVFFGTGLFLFNSLRQLGIVLLHCSVLLLLLLLHVLATCFPE